MIRNEKHSFIYHWYDRMYITLGGRRALLGGVPLKLRQFNTAIGEIKKKVLLNTVSLRNIDDSW